MKADPINKAWATRIFYPSQVTKRWNKLVLVYSVSIAIKSDGNSTSYVNHQATKERAFHIITWLADLNNTINPTPHPHHTSQWLLS